MPSEAQSQEPRNRGPAPPITRAGRSALFAKAAATCSTPEKRLRGRPRKDGSTGRSASPPPPAPHPKSRNTGRSRGRVLEEERMDVPERKRSQKELKEGKRKTTGWRQSTSRRKTNPKPEHKDEPSQGRQSPEPEPSPDSGPAFLDFTYPDSSPKPGPRVRGEDKVGYVLPAQPSSPRPAHLQMIPGSCTPDSTLCPLPPSPNCNLSHCAVSSPRPATQLVDEDQPILSCSPSLTEAICSTCTVIVETEGGGVSDRVGLMEQSPALSACSSPLSSSCSRLGFSPREDEDSLSALFQGSLSEDSQGSPALIPGHAKKRVKQCAFCYHGDGPPLGQGRLLVFGPTPGYIPLHILIRRTSADRDSDCHNHCFHDSQASSTCSSPDQCEAESSSEFLEQLGPIGLPHDISIQSLFDATGQCCAHFLCAAWSDGVRFGEGQSLLYVDKAIDAGSKQVCVFCRRLGASLRCWEKGCGRSYHFPCAAAAGAHQNWNQRHTLCTRHMHTASSSCAACLNVGDVGSLLMCCCCGNCYHGSCLDPPLVPSPLRRAGWQCPGCRVCHICRLGKDDGLLVCERCDKSYHAHCLTPTLEDTPTSWICKNCRVCRRCGTTSSGQWANHPFLCKSCDPALPCPFCGHTPNLYSAQDVLMCICCYRCIHRECAVQAGEDGTGSKGFVCSVCWLQEEQIPHSSSMTLSHSVSQPTSCTDVLHISHTPQSSLQIICSDPPQTLTKVMRTALQQRPSPSHHKTAQIQSSLSQSSSSHHTDIHPNPPLLPSQSGPRETQRSPLLSHHEPTLVDSNSPPSPSQSGPRETQRSPLLSHHEPTLVDSNPPLSPCQSGPTETQRSPLLSHHEPTLVDSNPPPSPSQSGPTETQRSPLLSHHEPTLVDSNPPPSPSQSGPTETQCSPLLSHHEPTLVDSNPPLSPSQSGPTETQRSPLLSHHEPTLVDSNPPLSPCQSGPTETQRSPLLSHHEPTLVDSNSPPSPSQSGPTETQRSPLLSHHPPSLVDSNPPLSPCQSGRRETQRSPLLSHHEPSLVDSNPPLSPCQSGPRETQRSPLLSHHEPTLVDSNPPLSPCQSGPTETQRSPLLSHHEPSLVDSNPPLSPSQSGPTETQRSPLLSHHEPTLVDSNAPLSPCQSGPTETQRSPLVSHREPTLVDSNPPLSPCQSGPTETQRSPLLSHREPTLVDSNSPLSPCQSGPTETQRSPLLSHHEPTLVDSNSPLSPCQSGPTETKRSPLLSHHEPTLVDSNPPLSPCQSGPTETQRSPLLSHHEPTLVDSNPPLSPCQSGPTETQRSPLLSHHEPTLVDSNPPLSPYQSGPTETQRSPLLSHHEPTLVDSNPPLSPSQSGPTETQRSPLLSHHEPTLVDSNPPLSPSQSGPTETQRSPLLSHHEPTLVDSNPPLSPSQSGPTETQRSPLLSHHEPTLVDSNPPLSPSQSGPTETQRSPLLSHHEPTLVDSNPPLSPCQSGPTETQRSPLLSHHEPTLVDSNPPLSPCQSGPTETQHSPLLSHHEPTLVDSNPPLSPCQSGPTETQRSPLLSHHEPTLVDSNPPLSPCQSGPTETQRSPLLSHHEPTLVDSNPPLSPCQSGPTETQRSPLLSHHEPTLVDSNPPLSPCQSGPTETQRSPLLSHHEPTLVDSNPPLSPCQSGPTETQRSPLLSHHEPTLVDSNPPLSPCQSGPTETQRSPLLSHHEPTLVDSNPPLSPCQSGPTETQRSPLLSHHEPTLVDSNPPLSPCQSGPTETQRSPLLSHHEPTLVDSNPPLSPCQSGPTETQRSPLLSHHEPTLVDSNPPLSPCQSGPTETQRSPLLSHHEPTLVDSNPPLSPCQSGPTETQRSPLLSHHEPTLVDSNPPLSPCQSGPTETQRSPLLSHHEPTLVDSNPPLSPCQSGPTETQRSPLLSHHEPTLVDSSPLVSPCQSGPTEIEQSQMTYHHEPTQVDPDPTLSLSQPGLTALQCSLLLSQPEPKMVDPGLIEIQHSPPPSHNEPAQVDTNLTLSQFQSCPTEIKTCQVPPHHVSTLSHPKPLAFPLLLCPSEIQCDPSLFHHEPTQVLSRLAPSSSQSSSSQIQSIPMPSLHEPAPCRVETQCSLATSHHDPKQIHSRSTPSPTHDETTQLYVKPPQSPSHPAPSEIQHSPALSHSGLIEIQDSLTPSYRESTQIKKCRTPVPSCQGPIEICHSTKSHAESTEIHQSSTSLATHADPAETYHSPLLYRPSSTEIQHCPPSLDLNLSELQQCPPQFLSNSSTAESQERLVPSHQEPTEIQHAHPGHSELQLTVTWSDSDLAELQESRTSSCHYLTDIQEWSEASNPDAAERQPSPTSSHLQPGELPSRRAISWSERTELQQSLMPSYPDLTEPQESSCSAKPCPVDLQKSSVASHPCLTNQKQNPTHAVSTQSQHSHVHVGSTQERCGPSQSTDSLCSPTPNSTEVCMVAESRQIPTQDRSISSNHAQSSHSPKPHHHMQLQVFPVQDQLHPVALQQVHPTQSSACVHSVTLGCPNIFAKDAAEMYAIKPCSPADIQKPLTVSPHNLLNPASQSLRLLRSPLQNSVLDQDMPGSPGLAELPDGATQISSLDQDSLSPLFYRSTQIKSRPIVRPVSAPCSPSLSPVRITQHSLSQPVSPVQIQTMRPDRPAQLNSVSPQVTNCKLSSITEGISLVSSPIHFPQAVDQTMERRPLDSASDSLKTPSTSHSAANQLPNNVGGLRSSSGSPSPVHLPAVPTPESLVHSSSAMEPSSLNFSSQVDEIEGKLTPASPVSQSASQDGSPCSLSFQSKASPIHIQGSKMTQNPTHASKIPVKPSLIFQASNLMQVDSYTDVNSVCANTSPLTQTATPALHVGSSPSPASTVSCPNTFIQSELNLVHLNATSVSSDDASPTCASSDHIVANSSCNFSRLINGSNQTLLTQIETTSSLTCGRTVCSPSYSPGLQMSPPPVEPKCSLSHCRLTDTSPVCQSVTSDKSDQTLPICVKEMDADGIQNLPMSLSACLVSSVNLQSTSAVSHSSPFQAQPPLLCGTLGFATKSSVGPPHSPAQASKMSLSPHRSPVPITEIQSSLGVVQVRPASDSSNVEEELVVCSRNETLCSAVQAEPSPHDPKHTFNQTSQTFARLLLRDLAAVSCDGIGQTSASLQINMEKSAIETQLAIVSMSPSQRPAVSSVSSFSSRLTQDNFIILCTNHASGTDSSAPQSHSTSPVHEDLASCDPGPASALLPGSQQQTSGDGDPSHPVDGDLMEEQKEAKPDKEEESGERGGGEAVEEEEPGECRVGVAVQKLEEPREHGGGETVKEEEEPGERVGGDAVVEEEESDRHPSDVASLSPTLTAAGLSPPRASSASPVLAPLSPAPPPASSLLSPFSPSRLRAVNASSAHAPPHPSRPMTLVPQTEEPTNQEPAVPGKLSCHMTSVSNVSQLQSLSLSLAAATQTAKGEALSHVACSEKEEAEPMKVADINEQQLMRQNLEANMKNAEHQDQVEGEEEEPVSPVLDLDPSEDMEVTKLMTSPSHPLASVLHLHTPSPPPKPASHRPRIPRSSDDLSIRLRKSPFSTEASPETSPVRTPVTPPPLSPPSPPPRASSSSREFLPLSQSQAPPSTVIRLTPKIGMGKPAISKRKFSPGRTGVKQGRGSGFPGRRRSKVGGGGVGGSRAGRGRSRLKIRDNLNVAPGAGIVDLFQVKDEEENSMHNTVVMFSTSDHFTLKQDMCVVCGSFGRGAEGRLLACSQCGQCYHPYCVNVKITRVILTKGWRCLECTVCEACGEASDPGRLLLCDDCDISYHTYCLDPPLHTVPKGAWKCKWCVWCVQCGSTSPGLHSDWQSNYSHCGPCSSLSRCPLCCRHYAHDDLILQCQQCDRWVHAVCHGLTTEDEVELAADRGFECSLCRVRCHTTYVRSDSCASPYVAIRRIREPESKTFTQDGVCLTESGLTHLQGLVEPLTLPRQYRRCKPKLKLKIINQNSVSVLQMPQNHEPSTGQGQSGGDLEHDLKSDSSPERDHTHNNDISKNPEGGDDTKRKKRKPYRPGIGGFMVRQRGGKYAPSRIRLCRGESTDVLPGHQGLLDADVAMETAPAADQVMEKVKKRYRKKKTKLEESFPPYLQEAFFGRDLLDRSRQHEGRAAPQSAVVVQSLSSSEDVGAPSFGFRRPSPSGAPVCTTAAIASRKHVSLSGLSLGSDTSEPMRSGGQSQRAVQEEPLDVILSPELDKMVTDGAIISRLSKIPELEGKDVEEVFTAVLSPDNQSERSQNMHTAAGTKVSVPGAFPRLSVMNGLMASPHVASTPVMSSSRQGAVSVQTSSPEGPAPALVPTPTSSSGSAPTILLSGDGEQDVMSSAQRGTLRWEKEESLGELAAVAPVLYCNTNFSELREQYPEWSIRVKQIAKLWRKASPQDRAPFVQKARDNRAAQRINKVQLTSDPIKRQHPVQPPLAVPCDPVPAEAHVMFKDSLRPKELEQEQEWKLRQQMRQKSKQLAKMEATQKLEQVKNEQLLQQRRHQMLSGQSFLDAASPPQPTESKIHSVFLKPQAPPPSGSSSLPPSPLPTSPLHQLPSSPKMFSPPSSRPSSPWDTFSKGAAPPHPGGSQSTDAQFTSSPAHDALGSPTPSPESKGSECSRTLGPQPGSQQSRVDMMSPSACSAPRIGPADLCHKGQAGELGAVGVFKAPMPPLQELTVDPVGRRDLPRSADLGFTLFHSQDPSFASIPLSGIASPNCSPYTQAPGTPRSDYTQQANESFSHQSPLASHSSPESYTNPQTPGTPLLHSDPLYLTTPPRPVQYGQHSANRKPSPSHPVLVSCVSNPEAPHALLTECLPQSPETPSPSLQRPSSDLCTQWSQSQLEAVSLQPAGPGSCSLTPEMTFSPSHLQQSPGKQHLSGSTTPGSKTPKHPGLSEDSLVPGLNSHNLSQQNHMMPGASLTNKMAAGDKAAESGSTVDGAAGALPQLADSEEKLRQRQRLRQLILNQQQQKIVLRQEKGLNEANAATSPAAHQRAQEGERSAPRCDPFGHPPPPYPGIVRPSGPPPAPARALRVPPGVSSSQAPFHRELGVQPLALRFVPPGSPAVLQDSSLHPLQVSGPGSVLPGQMRRLMISELPRLRPPSHLVTVLEQHHDHRLLCAGGEADKFFLAGEHHDMSQTFSPLPLPVQQHSIMGQPYIELRHRVPENCLRLSLPPNAASESRDPGLQLSAVKPPHRVKVMETAALGQQVAPAGGREHVGQHVQQHLGQGPGGLEEHLEGEDSAVKDLEDVEVKDLVDLNLNLDPEGKDELDLGSNDLHLDDFLLSGKFDLIAYADPELNLEDKKGLFSEDLDLGESVDEKEGGGGTQQVGSHTHPPGCVTQVVKTETRVQHSYSGVLSTSKPLGLLGSALSSSSSLLDKDKVEFSGPGPGSVQAQEQAPCSGQLSNFQQQSIFRLSASAVLIPQPQGRPTLPHPLSLLDSQPHLLFNPQIQDLQPGPADLTPVCAHSENKSRSLLLEEQPLLLQDLLDQERQEQQQQKQMQALITQRSNTESCIPSMDFDSISDPIMKAKMVALKGINKVMTQGSLGLNPVTINRLQQPPELQDSEAPPPLPQLNTQDTKVNLPLVRLNPPSLGPGFVNDSERRQRYEEWLRETQQLLQMQQHLLEDQITAHRKTKKALMAKQRTARKAGRVFAEADAVQLRHVTEQQGAVQKQLEQIRKQQKDHTELIEDYRSKQEQSAAGTMLLRRQPVAHPVGSTLLHAPNIPTAWAPGARPLGVIGLRMPPQVAPTLPSTTRTLPVIVLPLPCASVEHGPPLCRQTSGPNEAARNTAGISGSGVPAPQVKFDDNNPFSEGFQERERRERMREQQEKQRVQLLEETRSAGPSAAAALPVPGSAGGNSLFFTCETPQDNVHSSTATTQTQPTEPGKKHTIPAGRPPAGIQGEENLHPGPHPESIPEPGKTIPVAETPGAQQQPVTYIQLEPGFAGVSSPHHGNQGNPCGQESLSSTSAALPSSAHFSFSGDPTSLVHLYSDILPHDKPQRGSGRMMNTQVPAGPTSSTLMTSQLFSAAPCSTPAQSSVDQRDGLQIQAVCPGSPSELQRKLSVMSVAQDGVLSLSRGQLEVKEERDEGEASGGGVVKRDEERPERSSSLSPLHEGGDTGKELLRHLLKDKTSRGTTPSPSRQAPPTCRQLSTDSVQSEDEEDPGSHGNVVTVHGPGDRKKPQRWRRLTSPDRDRGAAKTQEEEEGGGAVRKEEAPLWLTRVVISLFLLVHVEVGVVISLFVMHVEVGVVISRFLLVHVEVGVVISRFPLHVEVGVVISRFLLVHVEVGVVISLFLFVHVELDGDWLLIMGSLTVFPQLSVLPLMEPVLGVDLTLFTPYGSSSLCNDSRLMGSFGNACLGGVTDYYSQLIYKQNDLSTPPHHSLPAPTPPPVTRQKLVNGFTAADELTRTGQQRARCLKEKVEELLPPDTSEMVDVPASLPTPPHTIQGELRWFIWSRESSDPHTLDSYVPSSSPETCLIWSVSRFPDLSFIKWNRCPPAPSPPLPIMPCAWGKGGPPIVLQWKQEVKAEPSQQGPPTCSNNNLVTVAITLNPAAAENVLGVMAALAKLLRVPFPVSYRLSPPGGRPQRAPAEGGVQQTPPAAANSAIKMDSIQHGSSAASARPQWCSYCKVLLGNGLQTVTDLKQEVQSEPGSSPRFCSSDCCHHYNQTPGGKVRNSTCQSSGPALPGQSVVVSLPASRVYYINNTCSITVHSLPHCPASHQSAVTSSPPLTFPPASAVTMETRPRADGLKMKLKLKPHPHTFPGEDTLSCHGKRMKMSRWRRWSVDIASTRGPFIPSEAVAMPTEQEVDVLLKKLGVCLHPDPLPKDQRRCCFCHQQGDGQTDGPARLLNLDLDLWVHLNCALWSSEVYETQAGALINVELALRRGLTLRCAHCQQTGATSGCNSLRCTNTYHFTCALKARCTFFKDKTMLCHFHKPRVLPFSGDKSSNTSPSSTPGSTPDTAVAVSDPYDSELQNFAVFRRVYVQRDEARQIAAVVQRGERQHTFRVGSLLFRAVGRLLPQQMDAFHNETAIFPVGYHAIRIYWSLRSSNR
ncbi:LOW QUALITY PROTEIN: uncharacterized protein LOC117505783 [Thalassophryne amazonica]|uniref:LOW QUALITY PROTEIN: uncharacterized protein LOC117505783 n=1 Tax=Thalassophryne amazonica TaxID=390379 RepID=UPI001471C0B2|nr:LOW QUALITY PROTEIN: uncharacterized protein LOC117505783 [Thalassophryne amazonica]